MKRPYSSIITSVALLATSTTALFADQPKYSANVPDSLITPNKVQTKYLGELDFFDGYPGKETVSKTYDFLDTARAMDVYLNCIPATSMYAMLEGHKKAGLKTNEVALFENMMNARSLWLTPQTTTPYVAGEVDVKDGPIVIEASSGLIGLVNDAFFRYVCDIGFTGPDKGKGGKYLIVGPDYDGEIPEGYHVARTKSYRHWLLLRLNIVDGDVTGAVANFKKNFKMYPLSEVKNPPKQVVHNYSSKQYNTIHASDASFFNEVNEVIQYEPAGSFDPEIVGQIAAIGIKKGEKFAPDERMQGILKEAAAIGNAAARSITFRSRNAAVKFYPDRQWYSPFAGGSHEFENEGERVLDDRIALHFYATGCTPAMVLPKVGTGSVYEIGAHDNNGDYLDGGKTYSVTLPGPIPVNNFWSFMAYDVQTRSILETDQKTGGLDSNAKGLKIEADGSATVYFGPTAPKGHESNWVQTTPKKGFHVLLRLYGPLQPWFDRSWKPGDFTLVK